MAVILPFLHQQQWANAGIFSGDTYLRSNQHIRTFIISSSSSVRTQFQHDFHCTLCTTMLTASSLLLDWQTIFLWTINIKCAAGNDNSMTNTHIQSVSGNGKTLLNTFKQSCYLIFSAIALQLILQSNTHQNAMQKPGDCIYKHIIHRTNLNTVHYLW